MAAKHEFRPFQLDLQPRTLGYRPDAIDTDIFEKGEKFYLQGLAIDPKHRGINEYLGELYVATNRHNLAVERLGILESCNCKEYDQLKAIIAGEKVSKY